MAVVVCTVYERDDPPVKGGSATPLGTITELLEFSAREVISTHGFNTVQLAVNRHDTSAALIENHPGRWVTIAFPAIQTDPVMTVRLGPSHSVVLGEHAADEIIHVGGLGILSLAEDAKLLNTVHAPDQPCRGSCPTIPERWSWRAGLTDPIAYGGIVVRAIEEGQNQTGTPLDPWDITFDRDEDSDGNAWPDIVAEFQQPVGLSVMGLYRRIAEAGDVFLVERPDFTIDAYQQFGSASWGIDRTSATFATDKVRIYAAADDDDSNLLTGLEQEGEDEPYTHVLVKGMGETYAQVAASWYTSGPARWASIEYRDSDDTALLARVGAEWLRRQFARTVAREVEIMPGDDPANGRYLPWKHLKVGDLHTLDAGGIDEAARLLAIRVELVPGAHDATTDDAHRSLRVVLEYNETTGEEGEGNGDSLGGEPGNCCGPRPPLQPTDPVAGDSVRLYDSNDRAGSGDSDEAFAAPQLSAAHVDASWDDANASFGFYRMMYETPAETSSGIATMPGPNLGVGDYTVRGRLIRVGESADLMAILASGGTVRGQNRANSASGIGTDESAQNDVLDSVGRIYRPGVGFVHTLWGLGDAPGTLKFAAQTTHVNRSWGGAFTGYPSIDEDDYLAIDMGAHHAGPTTAGSGFGLRFGGDTGGDLPEDQVATADRQSWVEFTGTGSEGSSGDTPEPVGPSGGGAPGDDTGTFTPINHVHAHGLLSTSETRYHDAADIEYDPTTSGLSSPNVQDALDELALGTGLGWFNVKTYGATGDGSTDDTAAIKAAIDAAEANGNGSRVYFPIGSSFYRVTDTLTVTAALTLMGPGNGEGPGSAEIRMETADTTLFSLNDDADRAVFEGLYLTGPTGNSSGNGILSTKSVNTIRVRIQGFYNNLHIGAGAFYSKHWQSMFHDADQNAVLLADGVTNTDFFGCRIQSSPVGLYAVGCEKLAVYGGSIEANTTYGARIDSGTQTTEAVLFSGVYFENPSATDIRIGQSGGTVYSVRVESCHHNTGATWFIDAATVNGLTLADNSYATGAGDRSKIRATGSSANVTIGHNSGTGPYDGTLPSSTIFLDPAGLDARYIGGVEITGTPTAGQVPIASDSDSAAWGTLDIPEAAAPYITVDPGTPTYDDSGPDVEVTIASKWGHDGTDPYFNDAGVTAGEEAALVFDPATRDFAVVPYQEP